jgi:hypothetical protein
MSRRPQFFIGCKRRLVGANALARRTENTE